MSLFSSSYLVPCWVCKKQIAGVFWGYMARWLHDYLNYFKLPKVMTCSSFASAFVPYFNLDMFLNVNVFLYLWCTNYHLLFCDQVSSINCFKKKGGLQHLPLYFPKRLGHHPPCYWMVSKILTAAFHCSSNFYSQALGNPTQLYVWDGILKQPHSNT